MSSKFMRILVMFDLPVMEPYQRKAAAKFRNFLLKDGYLMIQFSVYSRICNGTDAVEKHEMRLKANLPKEGSIRMLTLTEKQYESIKILIGEQVFDDKIDSDELTDFF